MKEQLYTIPLMDAFQEQDECPFCFIRRSLEQHEMDFVLGSQASYMEDDVRAKTDEYGFCRDHYHKMFTYGNRLGSALILETHLKRLNKDLKKQLDGYIPGKSSLLGRFKKPSGDSNSSPLTSWIRRETGKCYICEHMETIYKRYLDTFFELFKKDPEFRTLLKNGKGFCLEHFGDLVDGAEKRLNEKEKSELIKIIFPQMTENLDRVIEDVEWFQKKFDYQFKEADWKNSKDAVQRAMQKAGGGYPADEPYVSK